MPDFLNKRAENFQMENTKKLYTAFAKALMVEREMVQDDLEYNSILNWDSAAHMVLVVELEKVFNVMLDTDDIIDMSTVGKAKEILSKYNVTFDD